MSWMEYLATHTPTDDDVTEALALRWPGYFADPPAAPAFPATMRLSLVANEEAITSMMTELEQGSFAIALATVAIPAAFVLGGKSPVPHRCGEATAATMRDAEVTVIPEAGHLPWHEHPGCISAALARLSERIS